MGESRELRASAYVPVLLLAVAVIVLTESVLVSNLVEVNVRFASSMMELPKTVSVSKVDGVAFVEETAVGMNTIQVYTDIHILLDNYAPTRQFVALVAVYRDMDTPEDILSWSPSVQGSAYVTANPGLVRLRGVRHVLVVMPRSVVTVSVRTTLPPPDRILACTVAGCTVLYKSGSPGSSGSAEPLDWLLHGWSRTRFPPPPNETATANIVVTREYTWVASLYCAKSLYAEYHYENPTTTELSATYCPCCDCPSCLPSPFSIGNPIIDRETPVDIPTLCKDSSGTWNVYSALVGLNVSQSTVIDYVNGRGDYEFDVPGSFFLDGQERVINQETNYPQEWVNNWRPCNYLQIAEVLEARTTTGAPFSEVAREHGASGVALHLLIQGHPGDFGDGDVGSVNMVGGLLIPETNVVGGEMVYVVVSGETGVIATVWTQNLSQPVETTIPLPGNLDKVTITVYVLSMGSDPNCCTGDCCGAPGTSTYNPAYGYAISVVFT